MDLEEIWFFIKYLLYEPVDDAREMFLQLFRVKTHMYSALFIFGYALWFEYYRLELICALYFLTLSVYQIYRAGHWKNEFRKQKLLKMQSINQDNGRSK